MKKASPFVNLLVEFILEDWVDLGENVDLRETRRTFRLNEHLMPFKKRPREKFRLKSTDCLVTTILFI